MYNHKRSLHSGTYYIIREYRQRSKAARATRYIHSAKFIMFSKNIVDHICPDGKINTRREKKGRNVFLRGRARKKGVYLYHF